VVTDRPALKPTAVLLDAVVFAFNEFRPTATLLAPVVFNCNAPRPWAVLFTPVVLVVKDFYNCCVV